MPSIDDKRLNEMIAGMKLYADMPYGVKINEFSAKDLYSVMVELRELRAAQQWVPVSERLPEKSQRVLAYSRAMDGTDAEIQINKGFMCHGRTDITHWMPLPPLPGRE